MKSLAKRFGKRLTTSRGSKRSQFNKLDDEPESENTQAHAPYFPPELVELFFQYLIAESYPGAFKYFRFHPTLSPNLNVIHQVDIGQSGLVHALRVCRTWYLIGVPLLYTYPYIISRQRIHLFTRTMETSSHLSSLVKGVLIVDQNLPSQLDKSDGIFSRVLARFRVRQANQRVQVALLSIMQHCRPTLQSVVFSDRNREGPNTHHQPVGCIFGGRQRVPYEKLMIYCARFETHFATRRMNFLQVLCMREVNVPANTHLPYLPRLHTLQIAQCHLEIGFLWPYSIPELEVLDIFETDILTHLDTGLLGRLKNVCLFKASYEPVVGDQVLQFFCTSAEELVVLYAPFEEELPDLVLHNLHSLTFFILLPVEEADNYYSDCLETLYRLVNKGVWPSLAQLILRIVPSTEDPSTLTLAQDKLVALCGIADFEVTVIVNGSDDWISSRLTGYFPL